MCDCLAWNPLWAAIAREARVRRPAVILAVLYLRSAPDQPNARSALAIGSDHLRVAYQPAKRAPEVMAAE